MKKTVTRVICGLLTLFATAASVGSANPFEQGTQVPVLSQEERASLLEYANNSKAKLEQALEDAKGLPFSQIQAIYLEVIKKVVIESAVSKPRSELLMRYALNQALELTYGIPTADGKGIALAGVLKDSANGNLLVQILEHSIHIALRYYQDDRKAIESGNLLNLPYAKLAEERLSLARTKWLPAVLEWGFQYNLSISLLRQYLATIANEEQQRKAIFAEEILKADGWLTVEQLNWPRSWMELHKRVRMLRKNLRQLSISTTKKVSEKSPVSEVNRTSKVSSPGFPIDGALYRLVANEGSCLGMAYNDSLMVAHSSCVGGNLLNQPFRIGNQLDGYFSIELFALSCMEVHFDPHGYHFLRWSTFCGGNNSQQQFKIETVGDKVRIHPKGHEQYCLDFVGTPSHRDALKVNKCNGSASQFFSFQMV